MGSHLRLLFFGTALLCLAQSSPRWFDIHLASGIYPEDTVIRYAISGDDLGRWVKTKPGINSYRVGIADSPNASLRAIFYAPGCAIETVDSSLQRGSATFTCSPLKTLPLRGQLRITEWLAHRNIRVQAKYVAQWAPGFLGIAKEAPLTIKLPDRVPVEPDGHFQITVPDLASDPHAGVASGMGELQLWAVDAVHGSPIAHLLPLNNAKTDDRTGSIRVLSSYPNEILFDVCSVGPEETHLIHRDGFVVRGEDPRERCEH